MYNIFLTGVFHLQFSTTNPLVIWKNRIELPPWSRNQRIEKRTWEGKITIQRVQQQEKEVSIDCTVKTHWNWETKQKKRGKKKKASHITFLALLLQGRCFTIHVGIWHSTGAVKKVNQKWQRQSWTNGTTWQQL